MQKLKILVLGRNKKSVVIVNKLINNYKNLIISKKPGVIISLGGDGTYLFNERKCQNIPKVLVRDNSICNLCSIYDLDNINLVLEKLNNKEFEIIEQIKLECKSLLAVNDIVIRNKYQYEAIRFNLKINNKLIEDNLIGDGVIISTPFGSTGYFNSIAKRNIISGIGLALNNVNRKETHLTLKNNDTIKFKLLRSKALISADNNKKVINLNENDEVVIKQSKNKAKVILLK